MSIVYDRCARGLRVGWGPQKGARVRKRSSATAFCPELLYPSCGKLRKGRREHLRMEGPETDLRRAQIWTWGKAQRIAAGA
eukprot:5044562-Alexandrium_andersonii.AAC.1